MTDQDNLILEEPELLKNLELAIGETIPILNDIKERISEDLDLPISGNKKDLACTVDDKIRIVVFKES